MEELQLKISSQENASESVSSDPLGLNITIAQIGNLSAVSALENCIEDPYILGFSSIKILRNTHTHTHTTTHNIHF